VVVDSTSLTSGVVYNAGYNSSWIWAEQTYGVKGAATGGSFLISDGALFGGRDPTKSDNAAALTTAEHVTQVIIAGADVNNVNSGFSFNAVTSTRDGDDVTGGSNPRTIQGSLRQFLINADAINNAAFGIQSSNFSIGGGGLQTITMTSAPPTITEGVVLDARTQEGFAGTPLIEVSGASAGNNTDGLVFTAGTSEVRGLILNQWGVGGGAGNGGTAIIASGTAQVTIAGNYIGTDATGTAIARNGDWGIALLSNGNTVGGAAPGDRNVISGNDQDGITIQGSSGNIVQGNYIGTDKDGSNGTATIGNRGIGVWVYNSTGANTIGGAGPGEGNVISGNGTVGNWGGRPHTKVQRHTRPGEHHRT
jgi:hypothetical protein